MLINSLEKPFWSAKEFKVLYHLSYWDGAYSGILFRHSDQQKYYFKCLMESFIKQEYDEDYLKYLADERKLSEFEIKEYYSYEMFNHRCFGIFKLNEQNLQDIEYNHGLFQRYTGYHTDWDYQWKKESPQLAKKTWFENLFPKQKREIKELSGDLVGFTDYQELYNSRELNGQI